MHGIDISHHQKELHWPRLRSRGVSFAILKATEGSTFSDPAYKKHRAAAEAVGIVTGAYHVLRLDSPSDVLREADHFIATADYGKRKAVRPACDVETRWIDAAPSAQSAVDQIVTFCRLVEKTYRCRPLLYISARGVRHLVEGGADVGPLGDLPLWVADHREKSALRGWPELPSSHDDWVLWQWGSPEVDRAEWGIDEVDRNLAADSSIFVYGGCR